MSPKANLGWWNLVSFWKKSGYTLRVRMFQGVEFWAVNTDAQALENSMAPNVVQIGDTLTRGLGGSSYPTTDVIPVNYAVVGDHLKRASCLQVMLDWFLTQ